MGNCCSRSSSSNFRGEGRTLGSEPSPEAIDQPPRPVPALVAHANDRKLGGGASSAGDARSAAARAAEERASKLQASAQKGKLSQQLAQQKSQTQSDVLKSGAAEERRFREVDQNNATLIHS